MLDLSLILSPFVYCVWDALRLWLSFILYYFYLFFLHSFQGRGLRGGRVPFGCCSSRFFFSLLSSQLLSLLRELKLQGLSPSPSPFVLFILAAFLPGFPYLLGVCIPFTSPFLTRGRGPAGRGEEGGEGGGAR